MPIGRISAVTSQAVAITGSQDLVVIAPASNKITKIHGWAFSNVGGTADAADAQEEILAVSLLANATSTGNGGAASTPSMLNTNDTAVSYLAWTNVTTKAQGAAARTFYEGGVNIRVPDAFFFTPETQPTIANAQTGILRLNTAPADSVSCSVTLYVEELP